MAAVTEDDGMRKGSDTNSGVRRISHLMRGLARISTQFHNAHFAVLARVIRRSGKLLNCRHSRRHEKVTFGNTEATKLGTRLANCDSA